MFVCDVVLQKRPRESDNAGCHDVVLVLVPSVALCALCALVVLLLQGLLTPSFIEVERCRGKETGTKCPVKTNTPHWLAVSRMSVPFDLAFKFIQCIDTVIELFKFIEKPSMDAPTCVLYHQPAVLNRGFHVGDARLGGVRIFDARIKIQHDAQWSVLTRASSF